MFCLHLLPLSTIYYAEKPKFRERPLTKSRVQYLARVKHVFSLLNLNPLKSPTRRKSKRRRTRRKSLSWERRTDNVEVTVCCCVTKTVSRKRYDETNYNERYKVHSTTPNAPTFCEQCSDICATFCKIVSSLVCIGVIVLSLWNFDNCAKNICHVGKSKTYSLPKLLGSETFRLKVSSLQS